MNTDTATALPAINVEQPAGTHDWRITAAGVLTDAQAAAITFRAAPKQVMLGAFVDVVDNKGERIGHVATAVYRERMDGPAYVTVTIALR